MWTQRGLLSSLCVAVLLVAACARPGAQSETTAGGAGSQPSPAAGTAVSKGYRPLACNEECEKLIAPLVARKDQLARTTVDTTRFKKNGPYRIGISAGYLVNSWQAFHLAHIKWAAEQHKDRIGELVITDANFRVDKQIADIESLVSKGVDALIYWPIDDAAIQPALKKAADKGIPVVSSAGGLNDFPELVTAVDIDSHRVAGAVALQLVKEMGGKGKIVAMVPVAGYTATQQQIEGLKAVIAGYSGIELLDVGHGDWQRQKAKGITENWIQRFPKIDGVFSPSGIMSAGMVEAFQEAGTLTSVHFSPGDEYNGWLKLVKSSGQGGAVTYPTGMGVTAVEMVLKILGGEPVTKLTIVPSEYFDPRDVVAGKYIESNRPDDFWASSLPDSFKPN